jgi:hypothetical protein
MQWCSANPVSEKSADLMVAPRAVSSRQRLLAKIIVVFRPKIGKFLDNCVFLV